ncbi:MGMT family protein [Longirhabdus pacifica]|uniref:MGMT family protein n=1 Tax=Longirhabdus pacifica TaxID=2305227 RepID=UPI001008CB81|nr:MGMT family protein [Longirhabdus pacifica]
MTPFTEKVVSILKQIPAGKVITYGQVANLAGSPRAARQVVRILHSMSKKYQLPWHRVINSKGYIALKEDEAFYTQKHALESEGITVGDNGEIELRVYQWIPE